jgi:FKBP12-rapamycin complex-associated protein
MVFNAYAKALHYKEIEFFADTSGPIIEDLISVNTKLQQTDAAWGTLTYAQEQLGLLHTENWYEKLGRWDAALTAYERKGQSMPDDAEVVLGKLRCLHALGHWEVLSEYVQSRWTSATRTERQRLAPLATAAAWALSQWDLMEDYISVLKKDTPHRAFYGAILDVHRGQYERAHVNIARARDLLDPQLTSLSSEGYGRAYE